MMPKVTEWLSPKGLPMASTKSPISIRSLSPSGAAIRSAAAIASTATSVSASSSIVADEVPAVGQIDADAVAARRRG